jgi:hypothetical protein
MIRRKGASLYDEARKEIASLNDLDLTYKHSAEDEEEEYNSGGSDELLERIDEEQQKKADEKEKRKYTSAISISMPEIPTSSGNVMLIEEDHARSYSMYFSQINAVIWEKLSSFLTCKDIVHLESCSKSVKSHVRPVGWKTLSDRDIKNINGSSSIGKFFNDRGGAGDAEFYHRMYQAYTVAKGLKLDVANYNQLQNYNQYYMFHSLIINAYEFKTIDCIENEDFRFSTSTIFVSLPSSDTFILWDMSFDYKVDIIFDKRYDNELISEVKFIESSASKNENEFHCYLMVHTIEAKSSDTEKSKHYYHFYETKRDSRSSGGKFNIFFKLTVECHNILISLSQISEKENHPNTTHKSQQEQLQSTYQEKGVYSKLKTVTLEKESSSANENMEVLIIENQGLIVFYSSESANFTFVEMTNTGTHAPKLAKVISLPLGYTDWKFSEQKQKIFALSSDRILIYSMLNDTFEEECFPVKMVNPQLLSFKDHNHSPHHHFNNLIIFDAANCLVYNAEKKSFKKLNLLNTQDTILNIIQQNGNLHILMKYDETSIQPTSGSGSGSGSDGNTNSSVYGTKYTSISLNEFLSASTFPSEGYINFPNAILDVERIINEFNKYLVFQHSKPSFSTTLKFTIVDMQTHQSTNLTIEDLRNKAVIRYENLKLLIQAGDGIKYYDFGLREKLDKIPMKLRVEKNRIYIGNVRPLALTKQSSFMMPARPLPTKDLLKLEKKKSEEMFSFSRNDNAKNFQEIPKLNSRENILNELKRLKCDKRDVKSFKKDKSKTNV